MSQATGIHTHPKYKLGAAVGPDTWDKRTVKLENFLDLTTQVPVSWDFDKGRKPFPKNLWGNDQYGDCELAARANYLLRLQRKQTKTTPGIDDNDVIALYKQMTGCNSPGDSNDVGLSSLDNFRQWRSGWDITKNWQIGGEETRDYHLSAYGYVDPTNEKLIRLATYLFTGVVLGVNLPITAQNQIDSGVWDVDPSAGSDADPGSWGGHAIYSKRFDANSVYVLTWGMEIRATNAWINEYAMESYAGIDSFDTWFKFPHAIDIQALIKEMQGAGIQVQQ